MYILYYKEFHIVEKSHQTWRGKQLAMCEEKQPLIDFINQSVSKNPQERKSDYYIEETPW